MNSIKSILFFLFGVAMFVNYAMAQVPSYVPSNGLVGWWPFNGNANDLSGNGNHGTLNGVTPTTDRFGNANQAYLNNTSSGSITLNPSVLDNLGAFNVGIWFNASNTQTGVSDIFQIDANSPCGIYPAQTGNPNNNVYVRYDNGLAQFYFSIQINATVVQYTVPSPPSTNQWHFLSVNYSGTSVAFFMNGQLLYTQPLSGTFLTFNQPLFIANWCTYEDFNGKVDDIGIWNRALTQQEISDLYQGLSAPQASITTPNASICSGQSTTLTASVANPGTPCANSGLTPSLTNGLVGYWPFCGNANDASGNGNNGTVNGATLTTDRFGAANKAYDFNGSSRIDIGNLNNQIGSSNSSWSVNCWFKSLGSLNGDMVMVTDYSSATAGDQIVSTWLALWSFTFNHKVGSTIRNFPNGWDALSNTSYNDNQWHSMVSVAENGNLKIYIDGILITTTVYPANTNFQGSPFFRFGALLFNGQYDSFFQGKLDDIAIWNRALTQQEVTQLYQLGQPTYSWSNGATTPSITVSPAQTTTYTCTISMNGASTTQSQTITVNALPSVSAGASQSVCTGTTVTLNGSGALSYAWTNGVANGVSFTPSTTQTYTVTGTDANGCSNTAQVQVTVNALPSVSAGSSQTVCAGTAVTLNGSGALSYAWTNGVANGVSFTPSTTQTYTVTGTDANGCSNTAQVQVTVNALPSVSAGSSQTVCAGTAVTLNGSGALSYAWTNGVANGVSFTPSTTQTYTVTGTDANGCSNTAQVQVTVNALPSVIAGANQTVCAGSTATLNGSGAVSYAWNNNVQNGVPFTPNATQTYTVTGTDANGCSNTAQVLVTVANPTSSTITQSTCLSYTLNGQNYTQSGTYQQTLTNIQGCDSTLTLNLTVLPLPILPNIYIALNNVLSTDSQPNTSYQWIFCTSGLPIANATDTFYTATMNGVYAVEVSNICGTVASDCITIGNSGLQESVKELKLFPNPTKDFVSIYGIAESSVNYELRDDIGRLILNGSLSTLNNYLDLKSLAEGNYRLVVNSYGVFSVVKY